MAQLAVTFKASLRINKNLCQKRQAKFYLPFLLEVMFFMGQSFYGMNEHLASSLVVKNKSIHQEHIWKPASISKIWILDSTTL